MALKPLPEKMSICLVSETFPVIGRAAAQGFLWPIAKGLTKAGHRVTLICWDSPFEDRELTQDGVEAFFVKRPGDNRLRQFPIHARHKFEELHRKTPFDIVHSLSSSAFLIGTEKKKYQVAMAYDVQATKMAQLFSLIGMSTDTSYSRLNTGLRVAYRFLKTYFGRDRQLLSSADGVFVNSPQQRLTLERYYLYPELKTYQVPYGMEIGDLSQRQGSDELRVKLNIPKSAKVAVTVSDMQEKQEIVNILNAFQEVVIKKPSSYLIILGDGPMFKEIEYHMLDLALSNHVILTGAVPSYEVPDYVDLANVFINIGARTSGFEPSLLEAMIQEKVIIGSEVSPISTIVEDAVDGFLIRPADVYALSQLLLNLFLNNISSEQVGQNARKKVLDLFNTQRMIQEMVGAYEDILVSTGKYQKSRDA